MRRVSRYGRIVDDDKIIDDNKQLPPIKQQIINAGNAVNRIVSNIIHNKPIKADDDIISKRKEICSTCQFLINNSRCSRCGCYYNIKITLSTEKCPVNKW